MEAELEGLSLEEKKEKRQEASRPILDAFWSWVEKTAAKHTTNERLTQALTYSTNQAKGFGIISRRWKDSSFQ